MPYLFPNQLIAIVKALKHTVILCLDALQLRAISRPPHIHEIGRNTNPQGDILSYRTVYDCFKRVVAQMGIPEMRFHDLRHSYAVISLRSGDDIKTLQSNLGHASAAFTLDVYGHITEDMKKASADRMESFIKAVEKL